MYRGCSGPTARSLEDVVKLRDAHRGQRQPKTDDIGVFGGIAYILVDQCLVDGCCLQVQ